MSDTRDDFVISFKAHGGYDSPLIAVKAATAPELFDKIKSLEAAGVVAEAGNFATSFAAQFNVGSALGGTPVNNPVGQAAPAQQYAPPAAAAPAGSPPGMTPPTCPHSQQFGPKKWKTGQGKRGPWQAWMCPAPQGTQGQCPPEWVN